MFLPLTVREGSNPETGSSPLSELEITLHNPASLQRAAPWCRRRDRSPRHFFLGRTLAAGRQPNSGRFQPEGL